MNGENQQNPPQYPQYDYPQQPGYPPQPPAKKEGIGKYIAFAAIGCFGFLAFIGVVVFVVFRMTADPVKVVNEQLAAIQTGDLKTAYSYCSSDFQKETDLQEFTNFIGTFPDLRSATEFSAPNRSIENGITKLTGSIKTGSGAGLDAEYRLVKETGTWKVLYMHLRSKSGVAQPVEQQQQQQQPYQEQQPQQQPQQWDQPVSRIAIQNIRISKEPQGDETVKVNIDFDVINFTCEPGTGCHGNVVQDLKTIGPDGNQLSELSKDAIWEWNETVPQGTPSIQFNNWLRIPLSYPQGTYTFVLTVHDQFSGESAEASNSFVFP